MVRPRLGGTAGARRRGLAANRFIVTLDNNSELSCLQLHRRSASRASRQSCILIDRDGAASSLDGPALQLDALGTWVSPRDGARYPAGWRLSEATSRFDLRMEPVLEDQEANLTLRIWGGAVRVSGTFEGDPVEGKGHVELSGYDKDSSVACAFDRSNHASNEQSKRPCSQDSVRYDNLYGRPRYRARRSMLMALNQRGTPPASSWLGVYALILLCLSILGGCSDEGQTASSESKPAQPGPIPATTQRPGDPDLGRDALLNNAYVTSGAPLSAYRRVATGPADVLPGRRGRNVELPYSLTAHTDSEGVELVTSNCLGCHAASFQGKLVVGLGNEFLDFTVDPMEAVENLGLYVAPGAESRAWQKWAARVEAIAPYMVTDTVGVDPADNLTLALLAHRDPKTLAWSPEPLLEPPPEQPLPVSVPPWWRMQKKHAIFYDAQGRGDHARFMMLISAVCTDSVQEAKSIDAYFPDIRAYIASLRAPEYPYEIDGKLAETGERTFTETCVRCHGRYGEDWTYPNLLVALEEVGTDPELARRAYQDSERFFEWFQASFYGELAEAKPGMAYVAPPLDGVWATAPYLHNGLVPSIEALLNSALRPKFWTHPEESRRYDQEALGWVYQTRLEGKASIDDPKQQRRVYDTTLPGYSNAGHTFGDHLDNKARKALLEYLKTL